MKRVKYSLGLWAFTPCTDRFATTGYRPPLTVEDQIRLAGKVKGLNGVILQYPTGVNEDNIDSVRAALKEVSLEVAAVDANLFSAKFKDGAFTAPDKKTRDEAFRIAQGTVDMAAELVCFNAGLWLGQDGFDYPFQVNHVTIWQRELEGVKVTAARNPKVNICVEYKVKEPRLHMTIGDVAKGILIARESGYDNVGITLDFGHALMCRENPAESAAFCLARNKLFSVHFNDCYGESDDDMIAGSVHLWEMLEFVSTIENMGYQGWWGFDIFPYREDLVKIVELNIRNLERVRALSARIDPKKLAEVQATQDSVTVHDYISSIVLG